MRRLLTISLAAVLAALPVGCGGAQAERTPEGERRRDSLREMRVRRGDFVQRFVVSGELRAVRSDSILIPRTPSWQVQIRWMEQDGARVTEGQKVIELDNTALASELEEKLLAEIRAEIDLDQLEADLAAQREEKEFTLEQRRIELDKARIEASIPEDILRRREYQEKQLALSRARTEYAKARDDLDGFDRSAESEINIRRIALDKARREVQAAEHAMDTTVLRAPRDGILVVAENPREGRKFQVGDSAWIDLTIARIPDLSMMEVEAYLNDVDDGRIRVGNPAECTLDAYPDLRTGCEVAEITPIAQETGWRSLRRAFRVRLTLHRTDPERMRPGMSVKAEVEALRMPDALLAPRGALDLDAEPPVALLGGGGRAEVELGPCNALECVVEDGLDEGDRLRRRT